MSNLLLLSTILITLALVFYSTGIWSERYSKYLKGWHVAAFWTGFMFDVSGTWSMSRLSQHPFNFFEVHTISGQIALWLMLTHAIWATYVVIKGSENSRKKFHRYSLIVWMIWLVPYLGGMIMGMKH
jgi:uncharacterized repeat protein (TIGR03987 family)